MPFQFFLSNKVLLHMNFLNLISSRSKIQSKKESYKKVIKFWVSHLQFVEFFIDSFFYDESTFFSTLFKVNCRINQIGQYEEFRVIDTHNLQEKASNWMKKKIHFLRIREYTFSMIFRWVFTSRLQSLMRRTVTIVYSDQSNTMAKCVKISCEPTRDMNILYLK